MDAPGFGRAAAERRQQAHPGAPTRMRRGWRQEPPRTLPITTLNICVRGTEQLQALFTQTGYFACSPFERHTLARCVSPSNISSPVFRPTQRLSSEKKKKRKKKNRNRPRDRIL